MIELKRLKLINWHNFENTTFDCARLTYMIGVNAVGKTTILDAIRYCLTTNRNFNALGNKKSGRTLQGSVHAKQRGENAYRRPGHTVAYIGAEFWDSVKHTSFVIAVRVESEGPMQELHPGDQTWYISEDGITLEQLPFIDPRTGAPSACSISRQIRSLPCILPAQRSLTATARSSCSVWRPQMWPMPPVTVCRCCPICRS